MGKAYTYTVARIRALESRMLSSLQMNRMIESHDLERAFFVLNESSYSKHMSSADHPFEYDETIKAELGEVYTFLKREAGDNESLRAFWRKYDYGNLKILIRAFKKEITDVDELLSPYGNIDREVLKNYVLNGAGRVPGWVEKVVNRAVLALEEEGNIQDADRELDKEYLNDIKKSNSTLLKKLGIFWTEREFPYDLEGDNKTLDLLRETKRKAFGVDPIIAFWILKEFEGKMISLILTGKKHHILSDMMKKYMREAYG